LVASYEIGAMKPKKGSNHQADISMARR